MSIGRRVLLMTLIVSFLVQASSSRAGDPPRAATATKPVCIRGTCFASEIALTEAERARGLMFREKLPKERGMLFVFPREGFYRFWMRDTKIKLDIIFIGADRRIVSIAKHAAPCTKDPCDLYAPTGNVGYALEINGGLSDVYRFAPGDLVEFR